MKLHRVTVVINNIFESEIAPRMQTFQQNSYLCSSASLRGAADVIVVNHIEGKLKMFALFFLWLKANSSNILHSLCPSSLKFLPIPASRSHISFLNDLFPSKSKTQKELYCKLCFFAFFPSNFELVFSSRSCFHYNPLSFLLQTFFLNYYKPFPFRLQDFYKKRRLRFNQLKRRVL